MTPSSTGSTDPEHLWPCSISAEYSVPWPPEDYNYAKTCWDLGPGCLPSQFAGQMVPVVSWNSPSLVWQLTQGQRPPCACLSLMLFDTGWCLPCLGVTYQRCFVDLLGVMDESSVLQEVQATQALGPVACSREPWEVSGGHDWPSLPSSR